MKSLWEELHISQGRKGNLLLIERLSVAAGEHHASVYQDEGKKNIFFDYGLTHFRRKSPINNN